MADPNRADEIVMTAVAAHILGVHVGQVVPFGIYTQEQENLPAFGTPSVPPHRRMNAHLVGLIQLNNAIVEDDVDRFPTFIVFTPALTKEVLADSGIGAGGAVSYGLQLDHGNSGVAAVEREFARLVPPGAAYEFHATAPIAAKVNRTVKPLSIALGVFGAVAALAALLIAIQAISRQLRDADGDLTVLRALGAGPTTIAADGLMGILRVSQRPWQRWRRRDYRPRPSSGCASPLIRAGVALRCPCARRYWALSSPWRSLSPPSPLEAVCDPWCHIPRSTGGTGAT